MEVYEAIRKRRSIRAYEDKLVPDETLRHVLEAARLAPSASNRQMWRFIAVSDADKRRKLVAAAWGQEFLGLAPVALVFCATEGESIMPCGQNAGTVDVSIALSYVTLAAAAEGLGTCWLGAFQADVVREVLGIPAEAHVVAMSPLGYPAERPDARPRKAFEEVVSYDAW